MARNRKPPRTFASADGTPWGVEVALPSYSSAMVIFHHPNGGTARRDRYAWYNVQGAEALNVGGRVDPRTVMDAITDQQLALLFRRSMLISAADNPLGIPVTNPA
ncbi:MAG TPA: hypothetical protein VJ803_04060 [Gemmatimonadaceae bacterium]|nr:hypothetical protein [Gemmatimonadaceae bacterium]